MTDQPPDRLALDPRSPHHDPQALARGVRIRFKGAERRDVEEYSVSEGWIRVAVGKTRDRRGNPLTVKLVGPVEPWFDDAAAADDTEADDATSDSAAAHAAGAEADQA